MKIVIFSIISFVSGVFFTIYFGQELFSIVLGTEEELVYSSSAAKITDGIIYSRIIRSGNSADLLPLLEQSIDVNIYSLKDYLPHSNSMSAKNIKGSIELAKDHREKYPVVLNEDPEIENEIKRILQSSL